MFMLNSYASLLFHFFPLFTIIPFSVSVSTVNVDKNLFVGHVFQLDLQDVLLLQCKIKQLKVLDLVKNIDVLPSWLHITEDNLLRGLPTSNSPGQYSFNILIFGSLIGDYVHLCQSVIINLKVVESLTSLQHHLATASKDEYCIDQQDIAVLTLSLGMDQHMGDTKIILRIGNDWSDQLNLNFGSLQILSNDHPAILYKQLHSLDVIATSYSDVVNDGDELLFSWPIPCNNHINNITTIIKKLSHRPVQNRGRRDLSEWYIIKGGIRVRRDIFFGSISALVGTPLETPMFTTTSLITSIHYQSSKSRFATSEIVSQFFPTAGGTSEHSSFITVAFSNSSMLPSTGLLSNLVLPIETSRRILSPTTYIVPSSSLVISSGVSTNTEIRKLISTDIQRGYSTVMTNISTPITTINPIPSIPVSQLSSIHSLPLVTSERYNSTTKLSQRIFPTPSISFNNINTTKGGNINITIKPTMLISSSHNLPFTTISSQSNTTMGRNLSSITISTATIISSNITNKTSVVMESETMSMKILINPSTFTSSTPAYSSMTVGTIHLLNVSSASMFSSSSLFSVPASYFSMITKTIQLSKGSTTSNLFSSSSLSISAPSSYSSLNVETTLSSNSSSTPAYYPTMIIETTRLPNSYTTSKWFSLSSSVPASYSSLIMETTESSTSLSTSNWFSSSIISLFSSMTNSSITQYTTKEFVEIPYTSDISYLPGMSSFNDSMTAQLITPSTNAVDSIEFASSIVISSDIDIPITFTLSSTEVTSLQPPYLTTATVTSYLSSTAMDVPSSSARVSTTTVKPSINTPPIVKLLIDTLFFGAGRYSVYQVPSGVFHDSEDGTTRNLTLECFTTNAGTLDSQWLVFNSTTQTLIAFPLEIDYIKQEKKPLLVHFRAFDSGGLYATTQFEVAITAPLNEYSYIIVMRLLVNYEVFISNKKTRFDLVKRMSQFYQTELKNTLYIHSVRNGSTILEFNNYTLATLDTCDKDIIMRNVEVVKQQNTNEAQKNFEEFLSPEFPIINLEVQYHGICMNIPTQAPISQDDSNSYLVYIIPLIIIIIILIIIIIIVVIYCRRQRNKQTFYVGSRRYEKGQPALYPDELELQAPPGKYEQPSNNEDEQLQKGAYVGPYDNDSLDSPDYRTQPRAIKAEAANSISSDDDSFYNYKTPGGSPPEYAEPPPYTFPDNTYGSEL